MNWFPDRSTVCLAEVPGEISLSIVLAGCGHRCRNCHSKEYQNKDAGEPFNLTTYVSLLEKYQSKVSCILFFNGEYDDVFVATLAGYARAYGYKRALYTGFKQHDFWEAFTDCFDYLKVGVYKEELGGLSEKTTNQKMLKKVEGEWVNITSEFQRSL